MIRHAHRARSLVLVAVCSVLLFGAGASPVAAANGADVRATTSYRLEPEARVVRVRVSVRFKNVTPDTELRRYFYTGYALAIHPNATRVRAASGDRSLTVQVRQRKGFQEARVLFGRGVFFGRSISFRVEYELPDSADVKARTRVSRAYGAFDTYAFGEERADVSVVLPKGFEVRSRTGLRQTTTPSGETVLQVKAIKQPARWSVWISADRPSALRRIPIVVPIQGEQERLTVSAWPEDTRWARTVGDTLKKGLPVLGELIGLPLPSGADLEVVEVYSPLLGGYAGIYSNEADEIRVTERADPQVVLHEAAHAWFNSSLFRERWINEGLADEYAFRALERAGGKATGPKTVERLGRGAFALNAWPRPAPITSSTTDQQETYGYNASWLVVRELVEEVGEDRMREVLRAAAKGEVAYTTSGREPEVIASSSRSGDWRLLLDLLEERAGSKRAGPLLDRWVITPAQRFDLTFRTGARILYKGLLGELDGWEAPFEIRRALSEWRFPYAQRLIDEAREALQRRRQVEAFARTLGVPTSSAMQSAFEAAGADFSAVERVADEQLRSLEALSRARAAVASERDIQTRLGLLGIEPQVPVDTAIAAFARDDHAASRAAASEAVALIDGASSLGQQRLLIAAASVVAVLVLVVLLALILRRRRHRSRSVPPAALSSEADGA